MELTAAPQARPSRTPKKKRQSSAGGDRPAEAERPGLAARQAAHRLLGAIVEAHTPMDALLDDSHGHPHYRALDPRDRQLVKAILMMALRHRDDFEAVLARLIAKPLPDGATAVSHMLHCALAQILFLDVPDHSAVDLAVEAANRDPRSRRFASLVNAVTRRSAREREGLREQIGRHDQRIGAQWFHDRVASAYGADAATAMARLMRVPAPVDLAFCARARADRAWVEAAGGVWLHEQAARLSSGALEQALPEWPGFAEGDWWVQDAAAGIPAALMGDLSGCHVLDACAAPGGKTAQLLDAGAQVTALDMSANRLRRLQGNLERLGLGARCTTLAGDLFKHEPDRPYDAILLDAPCSSTGTVRRHPDVPWVKTPGDIDTLADLQARMLDHAASLVAPGGVVVFSNCSLLPREGEEVVAAFLDTHRDFTLEAPPAGSLDWLADCIDGTGCVRTTPLHLPHDDARMSGMDGFFAARLVRKP